MVKQCNAAKKAAITRECAKYTDMITGKIVRNVIPSIKKKFNVSKSTIMRINKEYKQKEAQGDLAPDLTPKKRTGRLGYLNDVVKAEYRRIMQEWANKSRKVTVRSLRQELHEAGFKFPIATVHSHLKALKKMDADAQSL